MHPHHSESELRAAALRYAYVDGTGKIRFPYKKFQQDYGVTSHHSRNLANWVRDHMELLDDAVDATERQVLDVFGTSADHVPPEFEDLKKSRFEWREWLDLARRQRQLRDDASPNQRHAHINLETDLPIAIAYTADWHLGSASVDYDEWERNISFLMEQDRVYLAVLGDLIDNVARFRTVEPVLNQVMPPKYQRKMLRDIINEMVDAGKLLYATWGNHDWEFSESTVGDSLMDDIYERVPSFADTGIAVLQVGDQRYTNLASHLPKYNSAFNRLHGNKQMHRLEFPADVVITAHTHAPDFETYTTYQDAQELGMGFGGRCIMVKVGTFKTDDIYSKRYYGRPAIMVPTIVYDPRRRDMTVFESAEKAVKYMRALETELGVRGSDIIRPSEEAS